MFHGAPLVLPTKSLFRNSWPACKVRVKSMTEAAERWSACSIATVAWPRTGGNQLIGVFPGDPRGGGDALAHTGRIPKQALSETAQGHCVRMPACQASLREASAAARGGPLCVWVARPTPGGALALRRRGHDLQLTRVLEQHSPDAYHPLADVLSAKSSLLGGGHEAPRIHYFSCEHDHRVAVCRARSDCIEGISHRGP